MLANIQRNRRRLSVAVGLSGLCAYPALQAAAGSDNAIRLGQSLGLTGPLAEIGQDIAHGAMAHFEQLNANGGIIGRKVVVSTMDDGYQVARTIENVKQLVQRDKVLALLNIMGTPNCVAVLPFVESEAVPMFAPMTGSTALRRDDLRQVVHVRASYRDEIRRVAQQLATVDQRRIAVAWQDNAFGQEGLAALEAECAAQRVQIVASASVRTDASNVAASIPALITLAPSAVVLITAGRASIDLIRSLRRVRSGTPIYTLSVMATQSMIRALGGDGTGVVVPTVVPLPWDRASRLASDYREAMARRGVGELSLIGFESYINARAITEILRRMDGQPGREKFHNALDGMRRLDLGGFELRYGPGIRSGSSRVELAIIASNGRFIR